MLQHLANEGTLAYGFASDHRVLPKLKTIKLAEIIFLSFSKTIWQRRRHSWKWTELKPRAKVGFRPRNRIRRKTN